jgi:hypothetical protein
MFHELNGLIQISHSVENYLLPLHITLIPHDTYPGLLWVAIDMGNLVRQPVKYTRSDIIISCGPLPSGILIINCGAQNAECCVKVIAFNGLPYADLVSILVFFSFHQAFNSGAKEFAACRAS